MGSEIQDAKLRLRQQIREGMKIMTAEDRIAASALARALLEQQTLWRKAQSILFFAPLAGELDVWPLLTDALAGGKTVALPRFDPEMKGYIACRLENLGRDVRAGRFGIREPAEHCPEIGLNRLDLTLVPGLAFDSQGRRLGRGKGFYDRLLAVLRGTTCGVAFDQQIVRELPVEPHDIHVNCILTPTRWIEL